MSARYDIYVNQGATYSLSIVLKFANGNYVNLTGFSARGQIRKLHRSDAITATFTCTIPVPLEGSVLIYLSDSDTANIPTGETLDDPRSRYVYDVEIENTITGEVRRILEGYCFVSPEVTRG